MTEKNERKVVIPGEIIAKGEEFLPGEGTEKKEDKIIALRYGLAEENNNLVKIIPISGVYIPRRGNVVIGKVNNINSNGWLIDITSPENAFLSLTEVPRYVNQDGLEEIMDFGDMVVVKIFGIGKRGIDVTIRSRGLGKIDEGIIIKINPNKVPRVIGKEGSMISMIKEETGCNITVGQNGLIWIRSDSIENELFAKKAIEYVIENTTTEGLTEKVEKWLEENKGDLKVTKPEAKEETA